MSNIYQKFSQRKSKWGLNDIYDYHFKNRDDFSEHMPYIAQIAAGKSVVEFGFRWGQSTAAFLKSAKSVHSFDIKDCNEACEIFSEACAKDGLEWKFTKQDSLLASPEKCDILFIDTHHTGDQIFKELMRHHSIVHRGGLIVMHDTETFAEDTRLERGMRSGLNEFFSNFPRWSIREHFRNYNGLTVLKDMR